jgi:glycosyltransferase involved in cell wall biosynthesis
LTKVLFIGNIWPEPKATAAGWRINGLISFFQSYNYQVVYASTSPFNKHSEALVKIGVEVQHVLVNDKSFDDFITLLSPGIVVFDRFMMEEQFGWRVRDNCESAFTILDTSDLHFLRIKRGEELSNKSKKKNEEVKLRELGSIYRCDLSLIISEVELALLSEIGIPKDCLHYLPFMFDMPDKNNWNSFEDRNGFVTIGSFLHEPNIDQIKYLKSEIWGLIRKEIPDAEIKIYGAYCKEKHFQMNDSKNGFYVLGFAEDAHEVISKSKVLLAPLRFGAGIKGKLLEAMLTGTPSVTSSIGKEGIVHKDYEWAGAVCNDPGLFAKAAIKLYSNKIEWISAVKKTDLIIKDRFSKELHYNKFNQLIENRLRNLKKYRSDNLMGSILNYHANRSTKFMSMWIESKNKQ